MDDHAGGDWRGSGGGRLPAYAGALGGLAMLLLALLGLADALAGGRRDADSRCPYEQALVWAGKIREGRR